MMRRFSALLGLFIAVIVLFAPTVNAYYRSYWCGGPNIAGNFQNYAAGYCVGYFNGGHASGTTGSALISGGVRGGLSNFETDINNALGDGGDRQMGASMVIDVMLGASHDIRPANGPKYNEWKTLVQKYDSAAYNALGYGIDWTSNADCDRNSAYASDINDDVFHRNIDQCGDPAIKFYWPGGQLYIIKSCGNLTGEVALPTPPAWGAMGATSVATDSLGNDITGGSIAAGRTIHWTHTVNDDGSVGPDTTPTISGGIRKWDTTGSDSWNNQPYSQHFTVNNPLTKYDNRATTNPGDIGTKFCEFITYNQTSSSVSSGNSSGAACVLVVAPPNVTPHTCVSISSPCTSSSTSIGVDQDFTAAATLSNSAGLTGNVTATWQTWLDNGDQTYGGGDALLNGPTTNTLNVPPSPPDTTFGTYNGTADATHAYVCTELYNVTGHAGTIVTSASNKTCIPIVTRPYFSVLGGDVAAGPVFGSAGLQIPGDTTPSIKGTNNDSSPNYNGAAAQLAALALGQIKSFATGESQNGGVGPAWTNAVTGGAGATPSVLAFANTSASSPIYGGGFSQPGWHVQNYYGTPTGAPWTGVFAKGNYTSSGLTLGTSTITADGRKIVLYVNGDVYINGNITYAAAGTVGDIPQFELLVSGNIYVAPGVTELDGFYDAQGDGVSKGKFVSCASSTAPLYDTANTVACAQQLTVNGAVAAQKVILNRTYGDINGGGLPQSPGETIRFSPLLWLPSATGSGGNSGAPAWQSVTSLPPIL